MDEIEAARKGAPEDEHYSPVNDGGAERRILTRCLQASSRLYMFFARQTLEDAGSEGETAVRESVRRYGEWRGTEMREAHISLGEPVNVETLMRNWDSASTYVAKDEVQDQGSYAPHDVRFDVTYCPAALSWKEDGFHRWGHVYCDEFHQAAASAYHPDAMVTIPINMMKGDDRCAFRWVMPNRDEGDLSPRPPEERSELGDELSRLYTRTSDESEGMRLALTRTNRLLGGRYQTFVQALEAHLPPERVRLVVERALERWSADRGSRLRQWFRQRGEPDPSGAIAWRELDLAPGFTWEARLREKDRRLLSAEILSTPLDDVWFTYGFGAWADLFWRTSFPALFRAVYPGSDVSVETDADGALRGLQVGR